MSISLMAEIWRCGPMSQSDRFVLLALADFANDDGECWPAIKSISEKVCMSERGVQTVIRRLEADGWLEIRTGNGRKGCNQYSIKTLQHLHPAASAPPQMDVKTPQMDVKNPAASAPEPLRTIKEPSRTRDPAFSILCEIAGDDAAQSFISYRKKIRKPMTERAAQMLSKVLSEIVERGGDADDALGLAELKGWQAIEADWYFNNRPATKAPAKAVDRLAVAADAIRSGKRFLCAHITPSLARELVAANAVTPEQCKQVGVSL